MKTYWKICARDSKNNGEREDYATECFSSNVIAIGWNKVGNLDKFKNSKEIKDRLLNIWTNLKKKQLDAYATTLWNFKNDLKVNDIVLCPTLNSKSKRKVFVGKVQSSKYIYDKTLIAEVCDFAHRKKIKWFSEKTLNYKDIISIWPSGYFGGGGTVSKVNNNTTKLENLLKSKRNKKETFKQKVPFVPDREWGKLVEKRAIKWLNETKHKNITDVSNYSKGWDIECGSYCFEVKGRKTTKTSICLSQNEYNAALKHGKKYTILLFTARNKQELKSSIPEIIPDPIRIENWRERKTSEYFLIE